MKSFLSKWIGDDPGRIAAAAIERRQRPVKGIFLIDTISESEWPLHNLLNAFSRIPWA
ncbi:hypothetical protein [Sinorhizobium sp. M4_45]|jgi:hypothetical protein|uniref:hypothetical protein n=1 Tax=Sinorhizobium TaxID=28105 RepID=UPI00036170B9|nr:hypothetical protein [Sinorhizobium sp. M4_45]